MSAGSATPIVYWGSAIEPPEIHDFALGSCAFLTMVPSGGFFSNAPIAALDGLLDSCRQWMTPAVTTDEPPFPEAVGRRVVAEVVGRRRLSVPTIFDDDYV